MTQKGMANYSNLTEKWFSDDLKGLTGRIECVKLHPTDSLTSVAEIVEILQLLHEMAPDFPLPQQCYIREAADELITLAIGHSLLGQKLM